MVASPASPASPMSPARAASLASAAGDDAAPSPASASSPAAAPGPASASSLAAAPGPASASSLAAAPGPASASSLAAAPGPAGPDHSQTPLAATSSCSARPARSARRPPTSSGATPAGSASPPWPPAAATPPSWLAGPGVRRPDSAVASPGALPALQQAITAQAATLGRRPSDLPRMLAGPEAVAEVAASDCDIVLNAVTGAVGLAATLSALDAGRILALANKESLIMGGPLVKARAAPGQIVPVDSEHSAIAQCLRGGSRRRSETG